MIFGNASWGFRETPLENQLKATKEMGLELLELGIANAPDDVPLEATDEELENIKSLYKKYNVKLLCAATGNDFTEGNDKDVAKIKRVTDICAFLGVKYLRIFAGFSHAEDVTAERWNIMISSLNAVYDYAEEKGVILTVETHGGVNCHNDGVEHFYSTSTNVEMIDKMICEVPKIRFNFDPANIYALGISNPETVYEKIKDRVCCVHLKDFVKLPSGHYLPAACGESDMDWKKLLKSLVNFDEPALFEYENTKDIVEGSTKSYKYILNIKEEI